MIKRDLQKKLVQLSGKFPIVSVTGPRQSGKTTLIKSSFPEYEYHTLEDPDIRILAENDPRSFLSSSKRMILDEIQRLPQLFSYIQSITDESGQEGQFIISGSQSFLLNERIPQSLSGRVAILHLLPFSCSELFGANYSFSKSEELLFKGFYPRIFDKEIAPGDFYPNYIQTYVERDVRLLQNIQDLNQFIRFIKLCAGRTGQLLNFTSLANDAGISVNTAKAWISVLEASFIIFLLQPHYKNFNKRVIKMPKLYFYDTGLLSAILDIHSPDQLSSHYLIGSIFENFVITELIKYNFNMGLKNDCYFWRDHRGIEVDCIIDKGDKLIPIEIKSSQTLSMSFFKNLEFWNKIAGEVTSKSFVVYGGKKSIDTSAGKLLGWQEIIKILEN